MTYCMETLQPCQSSVFHLHETIMRACESMHWSMIECDAQERKVGRIYRSCAMGGGLRLANDSGSVKTVLASKP
jgi:type II secretory pathway component PulL